MSLFFLSLSLFVLVVVGGAGDWLALLPFPSLQVAGALDLSGKPLSSLFLFLQTATLTPTPTPLSAPPSLLLLFLIHSLALSLALPLFLSSYG
ncbi:hypothetical protein M405DRAFT_869663 [Rhizopogon salebrosus TDB-379]|nr:hypothetical protein M405DRAFT_869663 [Rhizopogon salebrosus TDB-379]